MASIHVSGIHFLGILGNSQFLNKILDLTSYDRREIVDGIVDPVIRYPALWIIVRSDLVRPIATADHALSLRANFFVVLFELNFIQSGPKDFQRFVEVGML